MCPYWLLSAAFTLAECEQFKDKISLSQFAGGFNLCSPDNSNLDIYKNLEGKVSASGGNRAPVKADERQIHSQESRCDGQLWGRDQGKSGQDCQGDCVFTCAKAISDTF